MEPNQKVLNRYLNKVCAEVKAKGMHDEIREELSGHFADLMTERQQQGHPKKRRSSMQLHNWVIRRPSAGICTRFTSPGFLGRCWRVLFCCRR